LLLTGASLLRKSESTNFRNTTKNNKNNNNRTLLSSPLSSRRCHLQSLPIHSTVIQSLKSSFITIMNDEISTLDTASFACWTDVDEWQQQRTTVDPSHFAIGFIDMIHQTTTKKKNKNDRFQSQHKSSNNNNHKSNQIEIFTYQVLHDSICVMMPMRQELVLPPTNNNNVFCYKKTVVS
jgi:hypothetical protein